MLLSLVLRHRQVRAVPDPADCQPMQIRKLFWGPLSRCERLSCIFYVKTGGLKHL